MNSNRWKSALAALQLAAIVLGGLLGSWGYTLIAG
jgi:hypothetical protein